ncbi:MAG TPA: 2-amino-4-hydroxy-6-hydroxymethyldihydropteridine diphosphokinase [Burkholderiales bacterium]|jgi:2-amino-4-hydroxy-6-hydroxymethyldihydropteridine diphosphokinase
MPAAVRAYVGLGANLGEPAAAVRAALAELARLPAVTPVAQSSLYVTKPVDAGGPDYCNAAAALDTTLGALDLLHALQAIEQAHGRKRPYRNAPRTLDLDLLLYGDTQMQSAELTLPHPRMHLRAFVLAPLAEIAPDLLIPGQGAVGALLASITDQPIRKLP